LRITGNTFAEYRSAFSFLAKAACRLASESFGLTRRLPRALAAFRASEVRALIILRSLTEIAGCCARAAGGNEAATPPMNVMNSRLFTRSPRRRWRARPAAG
jgi:hypothetical protein